VKAGVKFYFAVWFGWWPYQILLADKVPLTCVARK